MSPPNSFGVRFVDSSNSRLVKQGHLKVSIRFGATGSLQTNEQIIGPIGNRVYGCARFHESLAIIIAMNNLPLLF